MNKRKLIKPAMVILLGVFLCFGSSAYTIVPVNHIHVESSYVKLEPITPVVTGEPLVVNGETNRMDGTPITITVKGLIENHTVYVENATFSAVFNTTGAPAGNYTVKADDGDGNIDEITVEILPIEPILTPKIMPTVTSTLIPISSPSPTPTITPTPTVTPTSTPVPIKKPQLEAIYELHPGKTKGEIEIKIYIRNIGDVNASNVRFEIDNPSFLNPTVVAGCQKLGNTIVLSATKLEPHEELVGSYSVTVPTDRDTEIRACLSYTDESGWEEIICIIII